VIKNYHTDNFFDEYEDEDFVVNEEVSLEYFEILDDAIELDDVNEYHRDEQKYKTVVAVTTTDVHGELAHTIFTAESLKRAIYALNEALDVLNNIEGNSNGNI